MRGSLRSHSHFTPCLLITRLISDPSLQEDPKINPLPSLLPLCSSGVILKVAASRVLWLSLLLKTRLRQAQGSVWGQPYPAGSCDWRGSKKALTPRSPSLKCPDVPDSTIRKSFLWMN